MTGPDDPKDGSPTLGPGGSGPHAKLRSRLPNPSGTLASPISFRAGRTRALPASGRRGKNRIS